MQENIDVQPPQSTDFVPPTPAAPVQSLSQQAMTQDSTTIVTGTVTYASAGQRIIASFIDGIVLGIPLNIFFVLPVHIALSALFLNVFSVNAMATNKTLHSLLDLFQQLSGIIILGFGHAYFLSKHGQTPGKKMENIVVIEAKSGKYLTFQQALLRQTVGIILDGFSLGIGLLLALNDPKRRTFHDKFVGSVVIKQAK